MTTEPADDAKLGAIIAPEVIISDMETLRVYFNPLRQDIMRAMAHQPRTVQSIAEELEIPFTRLYYHINMLEKHHLIQLVRKRVLSGAVEEKYYQITAYVYRVDRRLLTMGVFDEHHERVETKMDTIGEETRLDIRRGLLQGMIVPEPIPHTLLLERRIAHLSNDQAARFYARINELLDEFDQSNHNSAIPYALTVALHPHA